MNSRSMKFGRYDYAAFLCFASYAACSIVIPVSLDPLALDLNFPLRDGGMGLGGALQIGRSIPMVAAMLLCGFLAGRWGKRRILGISILFMAGGILLSALAPVYGLLFCALVVAGLGEGVIEGLATPVVQDLHPDQPGRYINFSHGFWSVGVVAVVLLAGALLVKGVSWRWVVGGAGALGMIPALMFLWPDRKKHYPADSEERLDKAAVWRNTCVILKTPRFWLFFAAMFLAGGGEFCLTFWCASFINLEFEGSMMAAGVGTAFFAGGMIVGRLGSGFLVRQKVLKELIVYFALLATVISCFFPFIHTLPTLFVLLFFSGIATGPFWPSVQSYSTNRLNVDNTMLFVLLSCAGVPGCGVFTFLMGALGDHIGLRMSFFLVPFCFLVMGALIALDWYQAKREAVLRLRSIKKR